MVTKYCILPMKCEFILDTNWIHKVILLYIYLLNEI